MREVARQLEGQLTATVLAGDDDLAQAGELLADIRERCGRFILNGVPTGVEVTAAMHHGGPYPATTDARFSSVGEDAIKRFSRPLSFQNWPAHLLPDELRDENPMKIGRWVDSVYNR
jgi:NADP-dependent aldehyde dehydrogenase